MKRKHLLAIAVVAVVGIIALVAHFLPQWRWRRLVDRPLVRVEFQPEIDAELVAIVDPIRLENLRRQLTAANFNPPLSIPGTTCDCIIELADGAKVNISMSRTRLSTLGASGLGYCVIKWDGRLMTVPSSVFVEAANE